MIDLVVGILVFLAVGVLFLLANLTLGKLVRPDRPSAAKGEVYECGEKPVGTAWIRFDLRFYVVALLFVVFDVEMAFFFPWAVVFGSANRAGDAALPESERLAAANVLAPGTAAAPDAGTMQSFAPVRLRGVPGLLRGPARGVRLPLAARRPRMGAQPRRAGGGDADGRGIIQATTPEENPMPARSS